MKNKISSSLSAAIITLILSTVLVLFGSAASADITDILESTYIPGPIEPRIGNWKVLVLMVEFPDRTHDAQHDLGYFSSSLFSTSDESGNPNSSMRDYFREVSYYYRSDKQGLDLIGDIMGWYLAPHDFVHYDTLLGHQKLVEDVILHADTTDAIDYSQYYQYPDDKPWGKRANVIVIYAGDRNSIKNVRNPFMSIFTHQLDGLEGAVYTLANEYRGLGTHCHEFAHQIGNLDLYDYKGTKAAGLGDWSLLGTGCLLGMGNEPVHIDAPTKIRFGWITPTVVNDNLDDVAIPNIEFNPVAYKLHTYILPPNEYFIVANRQKKSFDALIPDSGLLIYHVDENKSLNEHQWLPPCDPESSWFHYAVALEQADGLHQLEISGGENGNQGDAGDPFPGSTGNTVFDGDSNPSSDSYECLETYISVDSIIVSEDIICADFSVPQEIPNITVFFESRNLIDGELLDGKIIVDDHEEQSGYSEIWQAGSSHTLEVIKSQPIGSDTYRFHSWRDIKNNVVRRKRKVQVRSLVDTTIIADLIPDPIIVGLTQESHYSNLEEAVYATVNNSTIIIEEGEYSADSMVVAADSVTICGSVRENTTVNGGSTSFVLDFDKHYGTVCNLTIRNADYGIIFSRGGLVTNCNICDCTICGIQFHILPSSSSNSEITNCKISGHQRQGMGIEIFTETINVPQIRNCVINNTNIGFRTISNSLSNEGFLMSNCTIAHNEVGLQRYIVNSENSIPGEIKNSIFSNNTIGIEIEPEGGYGTPQIISISWTDIFNSPFISEDVFVSLGEGIIEVNPLFVYGDDNYHLKPCSPCVDAGNPDDNVGDEPEPHGDNINMGAYGGTEEATITIVRGDVNQNGTINNLDVYDAALMIIWPAIQINYPCRRWAADCNGNNLVNVLDVLGIVNVVLDIGTCPPGGDESPGGGFSGSGESSDSLVITCAHEGNGTYVIYATNLTEAIGGAQYLFTHSPTVTVTEVLDTIRSDALTTVYNDDFGDSLIVVQYDGEVSTGIEIGKGPILKLEFSGDPNLVLADMIFSTLDLETFEIEMNHQPDIPNTPYPDDGATDQSINVDLTWSGGDPDEGNTITYDVYFGTDFPLALVDSNFTTPSYDPEALDNGCTYYWQIVSKDNHEVPTYGPEWTFSTMPETVNLYPTKDAAISAHSSYKTYNYGSKPSIMTGRNWKYPAYIYRTLVEFDLSSSPSGATVEEALLHIFVEYNQRCLHDTDLNIYRMLHSWEEGFGNHNPSVEGATWLTSDGSTDWLSNPGADGPLDSEQSPIGSVTIPHLAVVGQEVIISLDKAAIEDMLAGGSFDNFGFLIKDSNEYQDFYKYYSSEASNQTYRPRLEIIYSGCGEPPPCDPPQISGMSSPSGDEGVAVLISGSHFGGAQGTSMVTFYNNKTATMNTWSDTQIECIVPVGAESGYVTVTTECGTSNGEYFTVNTPGCDSPFILSLSPSSGDEGSTVLIYGNHFGTSQGASYVKFNSNKIASISSWSNTQIECTVPSCAQSGAVTVTTDCATSNGKYFTVTTPGCDAPYISSLVPNNGVAGTSVLINGNYFGDTQGSSVVTFYNGLIANIDVWTDTQIECHAPVSVESGNVTVTTDCATSGGVYFTVEGCPYVSPWIGDSYAVGNNILAASEDTHRTELDVIDYFRLEQPIVEKDERYWLQIREFEQEHTWLDQVRLKTVDHPPGLKLGVTDEGEYLLYRREIQAVSCADSGGVNKLDLINSNGNGDYEGFQTDWLTVDFGHIGNPQNMYVEVVADLQPPPPKDQTIVLLLRGEHEWEWREIALLHPRQNWATHLVDLSPYMDGPQDVVIRLYWLAQHKVDYICLAQSVSDQIVEQECILESAFHSAASVVTDSLHTVDEKYAELVPGESIEVSFVPSGPMEGFEREFVFVATGHYIALEGGTPAKASAVAPNQLPTEFSLAQNYPNPFNPETEISFAFPKVSKVTLTVYNILGQVVEVLIDSEMYPGYHSVRWNGEHVASGIYFYRITTGETSRDSRGEFTSTKRMLLLK